LTIGELDGRVVLGRFRIVRLLARGGMGEIYLARSEGAAGFAIPVVVKRVLSEFANNESIVTMFKREARIMSNLRHPGIVSVLDFGVDGSDYVMVLEYVHGFHVGRWARWMLTQGQRFPVTRAVQIVLQMLDALQYAHTVKDADGSPLSVVHRDVSPSNVLIDVEGHVKLADFGVARMQGEQTEWKSGSGGDATVKGKFPYLAPELFTGSPPEAASDVYAAAIVLDELIRGLNAFRAEDAQLTIGRVIHLVPERLDHVRDDVPKALAFVIAKALSKTPSERWGSAEAFANALRKAVPIPQDQAQRELSEAARQDFHDPSIAQSLHVDDLSTLARAWREAPGADDSLEFVPATLGSTSPSLASGLSYPPTHAAGPIALAGAAQKSSAVRERSDGNRFRALLALGALAIVAVAVVGVVFALQGPSTGSGDRPVYLVVDRGSDGVDAGPPPTPAEDAQVVAAPPAQPISPPDAGSTPAPRPRAARAHETASLEAPFRRRSADIGRCFSAHAADLNGAAELVVRFELDVEGNVASASVSPPELARLPVGACVLDVARSTHFGRRSDAVSFRIPLGARRAPQ